MVGSEGENFDFEVLKSQENAFLSNIWLLVLPSLKVLILETVCIFVITLYTERGEASNSIVSRDFVDLIWHPTGSTMT